MVFIYCTDFHVILLNSNQLLAYHIFFNERPIFKEPHFKKCFTRAPL